MDTSHPHAPVLSDPHAKVLSALAGTTRPLTGREIARIVGMSQNGAWKILQKFAEHGLITEEEAGAAVLYRLNRDHLAAEALVALTRMRAELIERIKKELQAWETKAVHASMFGSAARGDGNVSSDIDLLIVRPKGTDEEDVQWREQINRLSDAIRRWTGNHAGIVELPEADLPRLSRERPPVVDEITRDEIALLGKAASDLFSSEGTR